jgi:hypothetical protein
MVYGLFRAGALFMDHIILVHRKEQINKKKNTDHIILVHRKEPHTNIEVALFKYSTTILLLLAKPKP